MAHQLGDPGAVGLGGAAGQRRDADLLGEHRDARGQEQVDLVLAHRGARPGSGSTGLGPSMTMSGWWPRMSRAGPHESRSSAHIGSTSATGPTIDEQRRPIRRHRSANARRASGVVSTGTRLAPR